MTGNVLGRAVFTSLIPVALIACSYDNITQPSKLGCGAGIISGYTDRISYLPGDEVEVFLNSNRSLSCEVGLYDIDDRLVLARPISLFPQIIQSNEPWKNGFNFVSNGHINLASHLKSGIYFIEKKIPFVIKSNEPSDVTVVYPSNTINAYDTCGSKSLYGFNSSGRKASPVVSFLRPINSLVEQEDCSSCLKWFRSLTNLRINYIADQDLEDYTFWHGTKIIVLPGHSEYWTRMARNNFDKFISEGGHAIILSGNTMWWQARYSIVDETLVCYKDAQLDPESDPTLKTIEWVDSTLHYPILSSIGGDFSHGGYGLKQDIGWDGYKIYNPASPLLEGLNFQKGDVLSLPTDEYDGTLISGFDADGFPVPDKGRLGFEKLELIGFDRGSRGGRGTIATFFIMQRTKTSGVIVNMASTAWCSPSGMGSDNSGDQIKRITQNAIIKLLNGTSLFTN